MPFAIVTERVLTRPGDTGLVSGLGATLVVGTFVYLPEDRFAAATLAGSGELRASATRRLAPPPTQGEIILAGAKYLPTTWPSAKSWKY